MIAGSLFTNNVGVEEDVEFVDFKEVFSVRVGGGGGSGVGSTEEEDDDDSDSSDDGGEDDGDGDEDENFNGFSRGWTMEMKTTEMGTLLTKVRPETEKAS